MIIRKDQAPVEHAAEERAQMYGPSELVRLSDSGGLSQFGAYVQTLIKMMMALRRVSTPIIPITNRAMERNM